MIGASFPLYVLRNYLAIEHEGQRTFIVTPYHKYLLDDKSLEGNYVARRIALTGTGSGEYFESLSGKMVEMKLYPLSIRVENLAQMIKYAKGNFVIDAEGKLYKYVPKKFFLIKYVPVLQLTNDSTGYLIIRTRLQTLFRVKDSENYTHVGYIEMGKAIVLFDLAFELKPNRRIKL